MHSKQGESSALASGFARIGMAFLVPAAWLLFHFANPAWSQTCCKVCTTGQACGNSCISRSKKCRKPPGCACNSSGGSQPQGLMTPLLQSEPVSPPLSVAVAIDGDTIKIDDTVFRLEGIDAPEMKQTCLDASGKQFACGRAAKNVLAKMLSSPVECEAVGTDKYGRTLAYCTSGGIELNEQMVLLGWAWAFVKYSPRYAGQEAAAREAGIGLWEGEAQAPWDWRAAQLEANAPDNECVIKGNISKGEKVYFMPFHTLYANVKIDPAKGETWFCTEDEAMAAGWRRALR